MAVAAPRSSTTLVTRPHPSEPRPRRFTLDEYHRMGEVGILHEDDRVELIRGELIEMSAMNGAHVECVRALTLLLVQQVGKGVWVHVQLPIILPNDSEPEPDFSLVRAGYGRREVPEAADVLLVIEVADSSLTYDRTTKLPLYAAAGIPEAWIFDITGDRVERYTDPGADGYREVATAGRGQELVSTVLPTVVLSIDAALSPAE
jgi:Uma2 family endonuclease